jgi:hypothetical protein
MQDEIIFEELSPEKTMEDYFLTLFKESDISTPEKILASNSKEIEILGCKYSTCCVSMKDNSKYKDFYNAIKNSASEHEIGIFHNMKNDTTTYIVKDERILDVGNYDSLVSRETIITDIIKERKAS